MTEHFANSVLIGQFLDTIIVNIARLSTPSTKICHAGANLVGIGLAVFIGQQGLLGVRGIFQTHYVLEKEPVFGHPPVLVALHFL